MADAASIAVIIPAYNAEAFLERAVRSVWATEYPNVEVVIIDDGSQDGTVAVARRLCAEEPLRCRLLRHSGSANLGVSASRNLGILESKSEWIAFLDSDDFYLPNRFESWRGITDITPAVDAVYELCEMRDDGSAAATTIPATDGGNIFGIQDALSNISLLSELLEGQCWAVSAITVRRSLLDQVGGFDVRKRIAEDCDLWFRLAAVGRIVPGDLSRPVSVYWRHAANTYHYQISNRVTMIRAMLDAWRWARVRGLDDSILQTFRAQIYRYSTRSIVSAREAGQPGVAVRILSAMLKHGGAPYFFRFETFRQSSAVLRELIPFLRGFNLRSGAARAGHAVWSQWVLPRRTDAAERRLESRRRDGKLPRVAFVKQDCNEDLYCCAPEASAFETIASTLLRSGPVSLFTLFDTRFFIVHTEADVECNIWKEKSDPLKWAPLTWFEAFREHVPGRDFGQSRYARSVDAVEWGEFDLVISVDVSVPARVTARFPNVVWAYYVRELKAPSYASSFQRPIVGQDLYLSQQFSPRRARCAEHVVDFPYHFHHCGVFQQLHGAPALDDFGGGPRRGVFVEYHTARTATADELLELEAFGPVYAKRASDDQFDAQTGERIPERSMSPEGLRALIRSKYHVKWGGRAIFGTAKVEAIAAGCVALSDLARDGTPFLHSKATAITDFASLVEKLRRLEADDALYQRELARQQAMVDYLCYLRPANDLIDAWQRTRQRKFAVLGRHP